MIARLIRQMMAFIENIKRVFGIGQDRTAAEREISEHQIVIGDNDIDLIEIVARFKKTALTHMRAAPTGALRVIGRNPRPQVFRHRLRPQIAIAIPCTAAELIEHFF